MTKKGRQSKGKEIRPTFFVFCEGETEKTYIEFLRSKYRIPIEIVVKTAGSGINSNFIKNSKKKYTTHQKDKTFLIYDCDVKDITGKLLRINEVQLLLSNPCFEIWYLLHFHNQTSEITSKKCVEKLYEHIANYKKGKLTEHIKTELNENQHNAIKRAKELTESKNPSTNIYVFVEELEKNILKN